MENPEKLGRFSSCRGVSFEIKPHSDPFAIMTPPMGQPSAATKRFWLTWDSNKILPFSNLTERSITLSTASSHFCDLDHFEEEEEEEEDHGSLKAWGEGHQEVDIEKPPVPLDIPSSETKIESPPSKPNPKDLRLTVILLDQGLFTVYKRLFLLCLALNLTALVLAATRHFPYAKRKATLFSIGNIFASILCRCEVFLRVIFYLALKLFGRRWVPLPLKTAVTSILQSVGGIHSGCGISSIAWLIYSIILTLQGSENTSPEIVAVASVILSLLCLSSLAAFPLVRHLHHNVFERTHRIAGWAALSLLWAFIFLTISYDPKTKSYGEIIDTKLIREEEFWLTLGITLLIILPWLTVRRVSVKVSTPSSHASIIKFDGGVKAGLLGRISPSPLSEWHAFGIISDGKKEHMMLAGAVGDFTRSLVCNPPSHLWIRQVHFVGLPYLANMYDRVLLVATGSGISVFLSLLLQPCRTNVCLLWVAKGIEQNFGIEIKNWVSGHEYQKKKVIVHDTAVLGRPNVSRMSVDVAKNWGAEVVLVTSNPEGSRDIVNACKSAGIAAFAPIWDS